MKQTSTSASLIRARMMDLVWTILELSDVFACLVSFAKLSTFSKCSAPGLYLVFFLLTGFTGTQCEIDIDECQSKPCLNGGVCKDLINDFRCTCATGFTGYRCQINIDDCVSNPCKNGGYCQDSIGGYSCECPLGFTGNIWNLWNNFINSRPP